MRATARFPFESCESHHISNIRLPLFVYSPRLCSLLVVVLVSVAVLVQQSSLARFQRRRQPFSAEQLLELDILLLLQYFEIV